MVRMAGVFAGGVLWGIYFPDFFSIPWATACIAGFVVLYAALNFSPDQNRFPVVSGLVAFSVIFLLGYVRFFFAVDTHRDDHLTRFDRRIARYEAAVSSAPEERVRWWRLEVALIRLSTGASASWQPVSGKVLLYVSKSDSVSLPWQVGDRIVINGAPQEIRPPANPGEFDFKRYLSFKNISHQHFVKNGEVRLVRTDPHRGLMSYAQRARAWSMAVLHRYLPGERERAIAEALILGVTDGIDNNLQNAYAASGAMYVLAVSGMHVGVIYGIVLFLLRPLDRYSWGKWTTAVVSLLVLWSFAFVTGLSPSVLRAVTMFSFLAISRPFQRPTNIYNTLAASVLLLLLYDPFLILSVGFQLSYMAVLGIVYLQGKFYRVWEIQNLVGDWIWRITCVSMAAQIATFAISLLYFHQFPTYFLLSNLFVIPLATVILGGGIFLLGVSIFPAVAGMVGQLLGGAIQLLNAIVFRTEALPWSLIENIYITNVQCVLIMGIILGLLFLFQFKSIRWLYFSVVVALAFASLRWQFFFDSVDRSRFVVYSVSSQSAFEWTVGGQSYFVADSALQEDPARMRFQIQPCRLARGVARVHKQIPFARSVRGVTYFRWKDKTFAWFKQNEFTLPVYPRIDFAIGSHNAVKLSQVSSLDVNSVIFDGTNRSAFESAENVDRDRAHFVGLDGAFILE